MMIKNRLLQLSFVISAMMLLSACQVALNRQVDMSALTSTTTTSSSSTATTVATVTAGTTNSTITGSGPVFADGVNTSTITITLKSESNVAVSGVTPTFSATDTGTDNSYGTCTSTNASGVSTCTLASSTVEVKTLSITSPISKSDGTVSFTTPNLDLESSIDMIDEVTGSKSATARFVHLSQVQFNSAWFDGTVSWYAEIIATNTDSSNRSVTITDYTNADAVMATVTVPSGTSNQTRIRTAFTSTPSGTSTYRVQMPGTTADNDLVVYSLRIVVVQTTATKTAIYFPLMNYDNSTINTVANGNILDSTTSTSYTQATTARYTVYKKDTSDYSKLISTNPWQFQAVVSNGGNVAGSAYASLYDVSTGNQVTDSEVSYGGASTTPALVTADFSDSATNFTSGDLFGVKIKTNNAAVTAKVYKAGIWLKLDTLTKAKTYYRIARYENTTSTSYLEDQRVLVTTGNCENATYKHEVYGLSNTANSYTVSIYDNSTNDAIGVTTPTIITNSTVTMSTSLTRTLSSDITSSITSGNRYVIRVEQTAGQLALVTAFLAQYCSGTP